MRLSTSLQQVSIPHFQGALSADMGKRFEAKFQEWTNSDYAGFRRLLNTDSKEFPNIKAIRVLATKTQQGATGKKIKHFVVLGTGGSSLGGETLLRALHSQHTEPYFHFMDNNDPQWFAWLLQGLKPEETIFYAVSKSGKTPETISQLLVSIEWLKKVLQGDSWKQHIVLSTDPEKGDLRQLAQRLGLACLEVPAAVGGRFSVLSSVGLFPAAFAGLKIEELLAGALALAKDLESQAIEKNPIAKLAAALAKGAAERPITVLMPYSSQLAAFSRWFCQLWGESLGKEGKGLSPYPAVGTTDQHSQMQLYMEGPADKAILFIQIKKVAESLPLQALDQSIDLSSFQELSARSMQDLFEAEFRATRDALTKKNVPNATIEVDKLDEYSLGALFYFFEILTAYAGAYLEVNPFDQPGVEAAKILTKRYLQELGK